MPAILAFLGYDPGGAPIAIEERLVRFRTARGWSQKRLAEELQVNDAVALGTRQKVAVGRLSIKCDEVARRLEPAAIPRVRCN